ncbi:MAG: hypothetical protein ACYCZN_01780 [Candidatus Dormibacteria bacterium]
MSASTCLALVDGGECSCVDPHPILASRGGETVSAEVIGYYASNVCRVAIERENGGGWWKGASALLTAKEARTLAQALMAAADRMVDLDPYEASR